jgi:chemotaxis regulatin CheY-phosphate phosphatase CheZ
MHPILLAQNINDKYDQLINYALKLLNNVEQNYVTIKREALGMVYILHNFLNIIH